MSSELLYGVWIVTVGLLVARIVLFVGLSFTHYLRSRRYEKAPCVSAPYMSIIVPCYNEEKTITNCVESLLEQTYNTYEIIVVDDGSSDATQAVAQKLVQRFPARVRLFGKTNGGKASALNHSLTYARGDIIVTVDADSVLVPDALVHIARSFEDPSVAAIGGNVKAANRGTSLGVHQAIEYLMGLNLQRRAFALLSCMQVISGAVGAFRKDALVRVGGYSSGALVEDMDVTIALAKAGYRIGYVDRAVAYTEVPETFSAFMKQRHRWVLGTFQVLYKYRGMLFNPSYGSMGIVGLPYFLLAPLFNVVSVLLLTVSLLTVGVYHPLFLLGMFGAMVCTQGLLLLYTIALDKEDVRLSLGMFTYVLWYQFLFTFITVKAAVAYVAKTDTNWNKLARLGKNTLIPSYKKFGLRA